MDQRIYSAKILVFGEYTVLTGGDALAMPFDKYKSHWVPAKDELEKLSSFYDIRDLLLKQELSLKPDLKLAEEDKKAGMFLFSDIPYGTGLGSSGNFSAAVYDRYYKHEETATLASIKADLAKLESIFHGKSSGLDPLCIYLDAALHYKSDKFKKIDKLKLEGDQRLSIFASGIDRQTKKLVGLYKDQLKDTKFIKAINEIEKANNNCIKWLIKKQPSVFEKYFKKLSQLQLKYWSFLIPPEMQDLWQKGIEKDAYYMKICGAGGGGYFLALHKENVSEISDYGLISVL